MLKWFLTGPDKPRIQDKAVVKKMYHTARVQAVTAMILGYGMYYVMRMTLGVAKKPMLQDGFTATELGMMGAGMLVAIAIGKCANGFIADHCNIKKNRTSWPARCRYRQRHSRYEQHDVGVHRTLGRQRRVPEHGLGAMYRFSVPMVCKESVSYLLRCFQYRPLRW